LFPVALLYLCCILLETRTARSPSGVDAPWASAAAKETPLVCSQHTWGAQHRVSFAHQKDDFGYLSAMMSGHLPGLVSAYLGLRPSLAWLR